MGEQAMITIEEKAKISQKFHMDESRRNFNKDNKYCFGDWNYGYCEGYIEALGESAMSLAFAKKVNSIKMEEARIHLFKAIACCGEEKQQAINELKRILEE